MIDTQFQFYEEDEIPDAPGLYAFGFRLADQQSLGIIGSVKNIEDEKLKKIKNKLKRRLEYANHIFSQRHLTGSIWEDKSSTVRYSYDIEGKPRAPLNIDMLHALVDNADSPISIILMLEKLSMILPPLYVGITEGQTLRARYRQHYSNFIASEPGTFGGRLKGLKVQWGDITYKALDLPPSIINRESLRLCEAILLALSKPILSWA